MKTTDLKSVVRMDVPVQVRPGAPIFYKKSRREANPFYFSI